MSVCLLLIAPTCLKSITLRVVNEPHHEKWILGYTTYFMLNSAEHKI